MISFKRFISIIASLVLLCVLSVIFFPKLTGSDHVNPDLLNDKVTVTYTNLQGEQKEYTGLVLPTPQMGETFLVHVPLDESNYVQNADLCFMYYHAMVEVRYKDKVVYSYGQDLYESGDFIGSVYVLAPIPEEAWGDELEILLTASESGSELGLDDVTICKGERAYLYYIAGNEALFACFFTIIVLAVILFVTLICSGRLGNSQVRAGVFACMFAVELAMWVFGYYGLNRLMFMNQQFCADSEYILLYTSPIPVALYMCELERTKREKIIYASIAGTFLLAAIVGILLNYTGIAHFSRTLTVFHILMGISCTYIIVTVYRDRRGNNIGKVITKYGITVLTGFATLDLIRFSIKHYTMASLPILFVSIVPFGIIIFIATLVYAFIKNLLAGETNRIEHERLATMAYTDSMTGLSNRAEYVRTVEDLRSSEIPEYAVLFFDLNYLKKTNDIYGHTMGDAYIKEVALVLKNTFGNDAMVARLGGDEFIAILKGNRSRMVNRYLQEFDEEIARLDKSRNYPFRIVVPYGVVVSNKKTPIIIDEAVKLADSKMYEAKEISKAKFREENPDEPEYHDNRMD